MPKTDTPFHSDTTATSLTHIFYELARNPEHIYKVCEEIARHISPSGDIDDQNLKYAHHLNCVIHETLRLYPPVPTALQRLTPPEGLQIGDTHIPGNVTVWCSQYAMGRSSFCFHFFPPFHPPKPTKKLTKKRSIDEKLYVKASSFIPERWYSSPEMIKDRSAFAPFSAGKFLHLLTVPRFQTSFWFLSFPFSIYLDQPRGALLGRYGCIGRPLAMQIIRTTLAKLLLAFEIAFPPGDDATGAGFEAKSKEHFTLAPGELNLAFRKRDQPGKSNQGII